MIEEILIYWGCERRVMSHRDFFLTDSLLRESSTEHLYHYHTSRSDRALLSSSLF